MSLLRAATSALLLALCLLVQPALGADDEALARLQRAAADIELELQQIDADIDRDRQRLLQAGSQLSAEQITPAVLEEARLEEAALKSRESGLKTRLRARRLLLQQLDDELSSLQSRSQRDSDSAPQIIAALALQQQQRAVLETLIERLQTLHHKYESRSGIAGQRLAMLQARFQLPSLDSRWQELSGEALVLQQQVDELLLEASSARRSAAQISDNSSVAQAQKRLLDMRALIAEEKAELQQQVIERLQIERVLDSLGTLSSSRATPVRVLKVAMQNLAKMQAELDQQRNLLQQKLDSFTDQRQIVTQQGAIATGSDSTLKARLALLDEAASLARSQSDAISALQQRLQQSQQDYQSALVNNAGAELLQQRQLPTDAESWQQLGRNLSSLPWRVALAFGHSARDFGSAIVSARPGESGLCLLLLAGLIFSARKGRQLLQAKITAANSDSDPDDNGDSAWAPLHILQKNLYTLVAPAFVLGSALILQLSRTDMELLLAPLLIWPVVSFALDFINNLLDEYTPELDRAKTRVLLLETRWVVWLTTILAAALIAAHTVALTPAVIDAIDRLSMLCLFLIAVPLVHLRKLLLEGIRGNIDSRVLRVVTLLAPLLLVLCAVIGIAGYVNLAQAIVVRFGWFIVVALGVHVVRGLLRILLKSAVRFFQRRDAESAPYWEQYILGPLYRVAVLLLVIFAFQLLFELYHWNEQTPIYSAIPQMLDATLFHVGDTAIRLQTLGVALLVLFVAIWGAGWSKQVSYRWVYTRVQDTGIRNSLSTFTQYLVVVLGLVAAMKIVGLDLTALTVFAGALGVGIGFGMQTIVVNFISGILLLVERPLATTDLVNVDKYEGEVTRIGIRSLTVKTFDNQEVIIPNSSVITKPFTNWTRTDDIMRTVLMIGISYDDDPHQAVALIMEQVKAHSAVLPEPAPKVLLWEYADSALMIRAQFHTRIRGAIGRADVRSQLLFAIWDTFKEAGITIPYPQQDVHLHRLED